MRIQKIIKVAADMGKDIAWFLEFLLAFISITTYDHVAIQYTESLEIDTFLTHEGDVWNNAVYLAPIPQ